MTTRKKKLKLKKQIPPHKRIPPEHGKLTRIAEQLYNLVFAFGLGGCWMSKETIAGRLDCCSRSVRRARTLLVKRQLIVTARTNPHTWIMWARYHPAIQNCQVLLYPIRQKMDNPYYEIPSSRLGGQKHVRRGDKMSPKLDVGLPTDKPTGEVDAETPTDLSPSAESAAAADNTSSQGASPPNPPAVQGGSEVSQLRFTWPAKDWPKDEELPRLKDRKDYLVSYGLTEYDAYLAVYREWMEKFTPSEIFWVDELMDLELSHSDSFDMVCEERRPGLIPWLNDHRKNSAYPSSSCEGAS